MKTIFWFLRAKHGNTFQVEGRGKRVNLGNVQGLQVPCTLQFSEKEKDMKILTVYRVRYYFFTVTFLIKKSILN